MHIFLFVLCVDTCIQGCHTGKWDVYLVTPDSQVLRSPQQLKLFTAKAGAIIDTNIVNFNLPQRTFLVCTNTFFLSFISIKQVLFDVLTSDISGLSSKRKKDLSSCQLQLNIAFLDGVTTANTQC